MIKASEARIAKNEILNSIEENAKRLKSQSDDTSITLNYEAFKKEKDVIDQEDEAFKELIKPIETLEILNVSADLEEISQDTVKVDLNEKWLKKLKKDVQLNEAVNVINDMKKAA